MDKEFYTVLSKVQTFVSQNHATLLDNADNAELLHSYIAHYLQAESLCIEGYSPDELLHRLVNEMTGYSILTDYLKRDDVEEINIDGWQSIKVFYANGQIVQIPERFRSAEHAVDVMRRILRESNMVWDNSTPIQVGHLVGKTRITAIGFDVVDSDKAIACSIRKVNPKQYAKEDFVAFGTATTEMMDFLAACYTYGISTCFTGATGSGKTTLLAWVLTQVPHEERLITIEQGTREFDCVVYDREGITCNSANHLSTRLSDNEKQSITQAKLIESAMTMDPAYLAIGESKGAEAYQTMSIANTGHSVVTTTHANSCEETYFRFLTLCKLEQPGMDDRILTRQIVAAFPLVVFVKKMRDHTRKVLQINEATCDENGKIIYRTLYRYIITNTSVKDGKAIITGHFQKENAPSEDLKKRLVENGLPTEQLNKIFGGNANEFH